MDLSIVIINYNTYELTCACIESVYKYTHGITFEIILVDNNSEYFDIVEFKDLFPQVKVIQNDQNHGFAKGNNLGIFHSTGRFILLLNSDIVIKDDAIFKSFHYLKERPSIGALSIKLFFPDGRIQSVAQRFPSLKYKLIELFRIQKLLSKRTAGRILLGAFFNHDETVNVDWIWGAYFMFRREILDKLPQNKLDETYFMYCEDMKWCMDICKLGYLIRYYVDAEAIHLMGGSNANKQHLISENERHFIEKNYSRLESFFIFKIRAILS